MSITDIKAETSKFFKDIFNIRHETDWKGTTDTIKKNIDYKGHNLWALIFAILIASVGLNVNSTAVVIGAMLISPLMGPIMGIGLALGTNDMPLFREALRNFMLSFVISILVAALYFWLTPLDEAHSELLARKRPTIFDVLIATFGGVIGIVVSSREGYSNAIPGVAIATALMPPLCTAGYGLANFKWDFFWGASYLFMINGIFIALTTTLIVRYLNFPRRKYLDAQQKKRVQIGMFVLVAATIIPSIFVAYNVVNEAVFDQRARSFVQNFTYDNRTIVKWDKAYTKDRQTITLTILGEKLGETELADLDEKLAQHDLGNTDLKIQQFNEDFNDELETLNKTLRTQVLEDLYKKNEEVVATKNQKIEFLETEITRLKTIANKPIKQIYSELIIEYPEVTGFAYDQIIKAGPEGLDTMPMAIISTKRTMRTAKRKQMTRFLQTRLQVDTLELIVK